MAPNSRGCSRGAIRRVHRIAATCGYGVHEVYRGRPDGLPIRPRMPFTTGAYLRASWIAWLAVLALTVILPTGLLARSSIGAERQEQASQAMSLSAVEDLVPMFLGATGIRAFLESGLRLPGGFLGQVTAGSALAAVVNNLPAAAAVQTVSARGTWAAVNGNGDRTQLVGHRLRRHGDLPPSRPRRRRRPEPTSLLPCGVRHGSSPTPHGAGWAPPHEGGVIRSVWSSSGQSLGTSGRPAAVQRSSGAPPPVAEPLVEGDGLGVERVVGLDGFRRGDEFVHDGLDAGRVAGEVAGEHPVAVEDLVAR